MIKIYSVIFTDPRYGDQDSMHDFYTQEEAREFGEKESRKYGISKFKVIEIERYGTREKSSLEHDLDRLRDF